MGGATTSTTPDVASMNLWQKLAAITGEIGNVAKDGQNRDQNYTFIPYASVAGALRTLFGKYHIVCIPKMLERTAESFVSNRGAKGVAVTINFEFTFKNADKPEEIEVITWVGEAADYGDKATNKAATAALKYCLMRTFNVSERGDEDPDSASPDRGTHDEQQPPKKVTIQDAIAQAGAELLRKGFKEKDERKTILLKIAGVDDVKNLKAGHMDRVLEVLSNNSGQALRGYLDVENTEEVSAEPSSKEVDS